MERKRRLGIIPYRLTMIVYTNGHPYSSGIYEVLRMVRKLTNPRSSYSGGVLSVFDGENGRGFRRKNDLRSNMSIERVISFVIFIWMSYHTNNSGNYDLLQTDTLKRYKYI